ncbi:putative transposase domain protein [Mycobacterium ulcerans str. Harvey]|uniref:Transposase domain protein n=1 Tax=Mycobacterium ulcerans str. Harvey TaxID=1299332 RepID=A0ABN0QY23_MYCUL|nr:putative transposase domain protein [Mycobacterium ulcerans str. Harvey]
MSKDTVSRITDRVSRDDRLAYRPLERVYAAVLSTPARQDPRRPSRPRPVYAAVGSIWPDTVTCWACGR